MGAEMGAKMVAKSFFFFKQKTAYEIRLSLVGSEMCIRDSSGEAPSSLRGQSGAPRDQKDDFQKSGFRMRLSAFFRS